jgi:hypothetical protein
LEQVVRDSKQKDRVTDVELLGQKQDHSRAFEVEQDNGHKNELG